MLDKISKFKKIAWWVAASSQLGKAYDIRASLFGLFHSVKHGRQIAFKIPDMIVKLR
jgi:hypothetical protein